MWVTNRSMTDLHVVQFLDGELTLSADMVSRSPMLQAQVGHGDVSASVSRWDALRVLHTATLSPIDTTLPCDVDVPELNSLDGKGLMAVAKTAMYLNVPVVAEYAAVQLARMYRDRPYEDGFLADFTEYVPGRTRRSKRKVVNVLDFVEAIVRRQLAFVPQRNDPKVRRMVEEAKTTADTWIRNINSQLDALRTHLRTNVMSHIRQFVHEHNGAFQPDDGIVCALDGFAFNKELDYGPRVSERFKTWDKALYNWIDEQDYVTRDYIDAPYCVQEVFTDVQQEFNRGGLWTVRFVTLQFPEDPPCIAVDITIREDVTGFEQYRRMRI